MKRADINRMSMQELTRMYNKLAGTQLTKFSTKKKGQERLWALVQDQQPPARRGGGQPEPSAPAPKKKSGARAAFGMDQRIKVLAEENPKREGSASFDRFALYRDGMSVAEYLDAGGRRPDLVWDCRYKFIAIALVVLFFMGGCASSGHWVPESGAAEAQAYCDFQAEKATPSGTLESIAAEMAGQQSVFRACMRAAGFAWHRD